VALLAGIVYSSTSVSRFRVSEELLAESKSIRLTSYTTDGGIYVIIFISFPALD
jgi:hypothetical protein